MEINISKLSCHSIVKMNQRKQLVVNKKMQVNMGKISVMSCIIDESPIQRKQFYETIIRSFFFETFVVSVKIIQHLIYL